MRIVPDRESVSKMKRPYPTLGELHVLNCIVNTLENMEDVTVFFQPKVGSLRPDIVVLRKGYGCTIIEVKDWSIESYNVIKNENQEDGTEWYLKSTGAQITSPHLQVVNYKRRLFSESGLDLVKSFKPALYGIVKTIIVLTNSSHLDAKVASHKYVPVLGRDGIPESAEALLAALRLDNTLTPLHDNHHDAFLSVLDPRTVPEEPIISVTLSERQRSALLFPPSKRRKIRGIAGSGKTIVGVTAAARAAAEGLEVLYLVYNNAAKNGVESVLRSINIEFPRRSVTVETIFKLARPFHRIKEEQFLLANKYFEAANDSITQSLQKRISLPDYERYDLIVIDEAQDQEYEWMQTLERDYLTSDGSLLILADEGQNIYGLQLEERRVKTPITGSWFRLDEHKRSDLAISTLCDRFRHSFLGDSESNVLQTEISLGIIKLQIVQDQFPNSMSNCLLSNSELVATLSAHREARTSLIIARTSSIIRKVTDECRKICGDRGVLSSMMETDRQRAEIFVKELKHTIIKHESKTRCATVQLTDKEVAHVKMALANNQVDAAGNTQEKETATHLVTDRFGLGKRLDWHDTLLSLYDRTLAMVDKRFDDDQHFTQEPAQSYQNDIVHNYSFAIARLRNELKDAAFSNNSPVVISTAHSSKGIERERVYLLIDANWHTNPQANELLYTAMTRARSELYVICSALSPYRVFFDAFLNQS